MTGRSASSPRASALPDTGPAAAGRGGSTATWRTRAGRVVFVANGSHATYSRPGVHDRPFPDPNDEADGRGRRVRPPVTRIDDARPAWVASRAQWGGSRAGWVPGEQDSPRGPRYQEDERWSKPSRFHRERAIACGAAPPRRAWQTALTAGLALVALGAAIALVTRAATTRRRRSRPRG